MADYFEIDFLATDTMKSCDAIALRYQLNGQTKIHIVDGGFQETGDNLIKHIDEFYGSPSTINAVVVTHPDGDHAGGLRKILDKYHVNKLWMLRPWDYADELLDRFSRFTNVDNLAARLKEIYPNIAALEAIANEKGISICEPFQGAHIGDFIVLSPTKDMYLDLIVESEKTPEISKEEEKSFISAAARYLDEAIAKVASFVKALWGEESYPDAGTSPENEMSIVQYANLCGQRLLLTGDAGRRALTKAADYAPQVGLSLPGIDRIQVPHHGSRHNVSSEILDTWLGPVLSQKPENGKGHFSAIVSASPKDEHHPRKAVIRGFIHRGANFVSTEKGNKRTGYNAPDRPNWVVAVPEEYPEEYESE